MNGNSVIPDTNIVLYLLNGDPVISELLNQKKLSLISLRKKTKLKFPDCIILTTARFLSLPLITSDQDFRIIPFTEIIIYE